MANSLREQAVLQTLGAVEAAVDQNMKAIDNLGEDDFEVLRQKRLREMKERQIKVKKWRLQGHGTYTEIQNEKDFFEIAKKSERVIVHFYRYVFLVWRYLFFYVWLCVSYPELHSHQFICSLQLVFTYYFD